MLLTRQDVVRIVKLPDKEKARAYLIDQFANPINIGVFAWFCFHEALPQETPMFHNAIWELYCLPGYKALAAPRGFAKSIITDLAYHGWLIAYQKKHCIVQVSDTFTQAKEKVEMLGHFIANSANFKWLYGNITTSRWASADFETSTGCRVVAKGSGQKLRGIICRQYRPDQITLDDMENEEIVNSPERRRKLKRWFLNSVVPALAPGGEIIIIGTILHHDSLLSNAVKKENEFSAYKTRIFKAINVEKATNRVYSRWPARFSLETLEKMRSDPTYENYVGSITFAQEYQNEPFSEEDAIIKPQWIRWVEARPIYRQYSAITIDPAISKKETADFTAKIACDLRDDNGLAKLTIFQIGNDRMDFPTNVQDIKTWNEQIKPSMIAIEEVAFQQAFAQVLYGLPVIGVTPDKDKRRRILSISRYFEAGQIEIVRDAHNAETLFNQLIDFPSGAHDDLVDAVYYAVMLLLVGQPGTYGDYTPLKRSDSPRESSPSTSSRAGQFGFGGLKNKRF